MTGSQPRTEDRLRETLESLANSVHAAPNAHRKIQAEWRRRERRRRLTLAILVAIVFGLADVLGLWALNRVGTTEHVIFNGPAPVQEHVIFSGPAPVQEHGPSHSGMP